MGIAVNNKQYEWGHINVIVMGKPIFGLRGIEYKKTQEKEPLYGRGNKPYAIQSGNVKVEGTLTLLQGELEAMCDAAGARNDVTQLPLIDIVVTYTPLDGAPTIDTVKGVAFTETPKGMKQGDKNSEHALPFIALDVEYGI